MQLEVFCVFFNRTDVIFIGQPVIIAVDAKNKHTHMRQEVQVSHRPIDHILFFVGILQQHGWIEQTLISVVIQFILADTLGTTSTSCSNEK